VPLHSALRAALCWFNGRMLVRYGGRSGGVVVVLPVDAQLVPRKETRSVEGRTPCNVAISGALTLNVSRGSRLDVSSLFPAPCHALGCSAGRLQKDRWDGYLFPITPPVTCVLGGEASGAFNAPARVRASGGVLALDASRFA